MKVKIAKQIGQALKYIRKENGLSLRDVGKKMGKYPNAIKHIEDNGIHGLDILSEYADVLGYDIDIRIIPKGVIYGNNKQKND